MFKNIASIYSKLNTRIFSDRSLANKAFLNTAASILDYFVLLVVVFFLNPFLVRGLGDYQFGVWQILTRVSGYISIASGRPTQALKMTIANQQYSNNYSDKRRQVGSAVLVWLIFFPIAIVSGILLIWIAPDLLKATPEYIIPIRMTIGVLIANVILTGIADVPRSVLRGENMEFKRMGASALLVMMGGLMTYGFIRLGFGLVGVSLSYLILTLVTGLFFLRVARENVHWFGIEIPALREIRKFFTLSGWFIAWSVIIQLLMSSDVIILGLLVSAEQVTTYTINKYAPEIGISLIANIVTGIIPGLGGVVGSGDETKTAQLRGELFAIVWTIAVGIGATALIWNKSFVSLWIGEEYYSGSLSIFLVTTMMIQFVIIRSDANIIDLTLDIKHKVAYGLVSIIASLIISGILIHYFSMGIIGVCLGHILGRSILSFAYPFLIGKYLHLSFLKQMTRSLRPFLSTILILIGSSILGMQLTGRNWIQLGLYGVVTLPIASALAYYLGLDKSTRAKILQRVSSFLPVHLLG